MLILTRRPGETIIIELPTGEQNQAAVLGVKGNQVWIIRATARKRPSRMAPVQLINHCF